MEIWFELTRFRIYFSVREKKYFVKKYFRFVKKNFRFVKKYFRFVKNIQHVERSYEKAMSLSLERKEEGLERKEEGLGSKDFSPSQALSFMSHFKALAKWPGLSGVFSATLDQVYFKDN